MKNIPGYQKRAPRVDLRRPAILIDSDGAESNVIVLDVSSGGFRLEVSEAPRIGEYVTLRAENRDFPAQRSAGRWGMWRAACSCPPSIGRSGHNLWEESVTSDEFRQEFRP